MKIYHLFIITCLMYFLSPNTVSAFNSDSCKGRITYDSTLIVSINKSLPNFFVHLIEREDTSEEYTEWSYELSFRMGNDKEIMQTICGESDSPFDMMDEYEYPGIEFIDLNFDGYFDIKMFNGRSVNGINAGYSAYLFNPSGRHFIYSEAFSEILAGTGIEINSYKHEITVTGELGCLGLCWSTNTYKVQGDTLILIRSVHQDQDIEHPGDFLLIKEELIDGKLIEVSRMKVNDP
jgi:hypothetical protein